MTWSFKIRVLVLSWILLLAASATLKAQGFGVSIAASPDPAPLSGTLIYTINVTNLTGISQSILLTNTLPDTSAFLNSSNNVGAVVSTVGNTEIFNFILGDGLLGQISIVSQPTVAGSITDSVFAVTSLLTFFASNSVVTRVTNLTAQADLAVALSPPASPGFVNDLMTYGISVTNLGPSAATNVFLSNTIPAGVEIIGITPSNQVSMITSSNVVFSLGIMANNSFAQFQLTFQPTNAAVLPLSAFVYSSTNTIDPNTNNNSAVANIAVSNYPAGTLTAVTNSAQSLNLQNGLTEQSILVSNTGANPVAAARVVVTGLTNRLYNAAGTNGGSPFVVYAASLGTNQSVSLLLQFAPRGNFPFSNAQLQAFPVPVPVLTPPTASTTSTSINLSRIIQLPNGNILLEWPSTAGRTYTVVYSDNSAFTNAMVAVPSVIAPANETQWIDYGPPGTSAAPGNSPVRFYRVFQNP